MTVKLKPAGTQHVSHRVIAFMVVTVCSVIAAALALQGSTVGLGVQWLSANVIGFSIWGLAEWLPRLSSDRIGRLPAMVIAVPTGFIFGAKISMLFGMPDFIGYWMADPVREWRSIGASTLFVFSATAFMYVYANSVASRLELEIERRRRAEASRSQAVAELGLLQAQIEPHFLFNTLAHVQSAFDQDPIVGKQVLEHLIRYLRGTLARSRSAQCNLAEEATLIESLLIIAGIRLGHRLSSRVLIAGSLGKATLPPLLLQPLVENAIKHGIEPAIDGGEIAVTAASEGDTLILRVSDTGVGMGSAGPEGVGLSNVRARLVALYGDRGRLTLSPNLPRGVVAELRLPLERN